jgi:hypothetical protein
MPLEPEKLHGFGGLPDFLFRGIPPTSGVCMSRLQPSASLLLGYFFATCPSGQYRKGWEITPKQKSAIARGGAGKNFVAVRIGKAGIFPGCSTTGWQ